LNLEEEHSSSPQSSVIDEIVKNSNDIGEKKRDTPFERLSINVNV
jgi:hypothetical protein